MPAEKDWFHTELGSRLRRLRDGRGLSQEELADRVGISRASISNLEGGRQRPLAYLVVRLADALGAKVLDLLPTGPPTSTGSDLERFDEAEDWVRAIIDEDTREKAQ